MGVMMVRPPQRGGSGGSQGVIPGMSNRDAMTAAGLLAGALAVPTVGLSLGAAAGAMAGGAATGGGLGSVVGGLVDRPQAAAREAGGAVGVQSSGEGSKAITRRLESIAADNGSTANLDKLMAAEKASASLPEIERQSYQPALMQARLLEQQRLAAYHA